MANQFVPWTGQHTQIVTNRIKLLKEEGKTFTVNQLSQETGMSVTTVQKRTDDISKDLHISLEGVHSKNYDREVNLRAEQPKTPKTGRPKDKPKKKLVSTEKFMCKCLLGGEVLWLAVTAPSKETASLHLEGNRDSLIGVYTMQEYAKIRLPSMATKARFGTGANSISDRVGRSNKH